MNARPRVPIPTITLILLNAALVGASVPFLMFMGYSWREACLVVGVVALLGAALVGLHLRFVRRNRDRDAS